MGITFNFESFFRVIVNSRNKWFMVILIATLQDLLNLTKADTIQGKKMLLLEMKTPSGALMHLPHSVL